MNKFNYKTCNKRWYHQKLINIFTWNKIYNFFYHKYYDKKINSGKLQDTWFLKTKSKLLDEVFYKYVQKWHYLIRRNPNVWWDFHVNSINERIMTQTLWALQCELLWLWYFSKQFQICLCITWLILRNLILFFFIILKQADTKKIIRNKKQSYLKNLLLARLLFCCYCCCCIYNSNLTNEQVFIYFV